MPRPSLRSTKQSVIVANRASLGDTTDESTSSGDDSTASGDKETVAARNRPTRHSYRTVEPTDFQFATPEIENNATDYGLEFTTSNIQNPSPRRCSTFRTTSSQEEQLTNAERTSGRNQQTASKNASKVVKKPAIRRSGDSDPEDEEAEDENTNHDRLVEGQLANAGRKQQIGSGEANKDLKKQNAIRETKKQSVLGEDEEEDSGEGDQSETNLKDNTPTVSQNQRRISKRIQQTSKPQAQPATKTSEPREQPQKASTSSAPTGSTAEQAPPVQLIAVAKKKPRKQMNPMQKQRRFLREVISLQNRCDYLIPRLPFSRIIREIMMDASRYVTQITPTALEALQTATEMYLTQRLQDAYMLTLHRGRITLDIRDMKLICFLKN